MPTKRKRVERRRVEDISETAMWVMSDGFYQKPDRFDEYEARITFGFPLLNRDTCRPAWELARLRILVDWILAYPGTRPLYWWDFDAPRMNQEDLAAHGWAKWWSAPFLAEPRRRLGGIGTARHDVLSDTPSFHYGIPTLWVTQLDFDYFNYKPNAPHHPAFRDARKETIRGDYFQGVPINPADPPSFESQAAYLKRHNLFEPGEERRLNAQDFEPELIEIKDQEERVIIKPGFKESVH